MDSDMTYKPSKLGQSDLVFMEIRVHQEVERIHDYKSLRVAVVICATMVNTQTHTQREREMEREREKERDYYCESYVIWQRKHLVISVDMQCMLQHCDYGSR